MTPADPSSYDYQHLNRELDRCKSAVFLGSTAAFLGSIMCSLNFIWTEETSTAATNGIDFLWNPKWFLETPLDERKTVLMHELWHVAKLHMLRRGDRCPDVWNYACDHNINLGLKSEGYPFAFIGGLHDDQYRGMAEEEIYDLMQKNGGGGQFPGAFNGGSGHDILPLPPEKVHQAINQVVTAVHQAKMAGAGSIPGGIEEILQQFLAPVVPWQSVLQRFFTQLLEDRYTWARPNRRYSDIYMPSRYTDDGRLEHLRWYIDVSGSITQSDIVRFGSELKYVKDTFNPAKLSVVQFDTHIQRVDVWDEEDPFERIDIKGRGDTSLVCVREDIQKEKPTAAIIFSDLFCHPMAALEFDVPVIWVVVNNAKASVPFGEKVHIKA